MEKTEAETPTPPPSTGDRFFAWMRSLGIQREKGWIGGVAAGIAVRIGIDPLIVRGILVVAAVLGAPVLLVYAVAWLLLPDADDTIHLERATKGQFEAPLAGIGVLLVLALMPVPYGLWFLPFGVEIWPEALGRTVWTLILIGLAVWFVIWISRRDSLPKTGAGPTPPPSNAPASEFAAWREQQAAWREENAQFRRKEADEKAAAWRVKHEEQMARHKEQTAKRQAEYKAANPHPLFSLLVIGVALVAGGVTALLVGDGELEVPTVVVALAVTLAVLAIGIIVNGVRGKRSGAPSAVATIVLIPLIFFAVLPQNTHLEYSAATFSPENRTGDTTDVYVAGRGGVVDLEDYYAKNSTPGEDEVYLIVGAGDVDVYLPTDENVGTRSIIMFGDTIYEGDRPDGDPDSGRSLKITVVSGGGDVTFHQDKGDRS